MREMIQRRPVIIFDFDDELRMAGFCVAMWPSDRTRQIRADVAAERAP